MSKPGFFFYTGDWLKDTRVLSPAARGCWIDALCFLNDRGGSVTWPIEAYANFWSVSVETATTILDDLQSTRVANVEWQNDSKTMAKLSSRRMIREIEKREQIRELRKAAGKTGAAKRWQKWQPSSSSSLQSDLNYPKKDNCPTDLFKPEMSVQDFVDSWNANFRGRLPTVEWPLSQSRHRKAAIRLKEHRSIAFWTQVFTNIGASSFLLGVNNGNWRCTFDFLINNDSNCIKIYEGAYSRQR